VNTTRYFREQVLRKRKYIKEEWCLQAIKKPFKKEKQIDGRIRYWIFIKEINKYLRVVTLKDGITIHNTFPDRNFKGEL
jgi:predicted small secreted protein